MLLSMYGCGLVMITPIGSYFGSQELIYIPIMLNLTYGLQVIGWALLTTFVGGDGCGLFIATHTSFFWLPNANKK